MHDLLFIGTGGSVATEDRDNTSFLLVGHDTVAMIDCPGSVVQKLKKAQVNPRKVHSLLVTHIHPDHIYGLPSLIHSLMLDECLINLYGSAESVDFCRNLLDLFHLRDEKIKTRVDFIPLDPGQDFQLTESLRCTSFEVPHSSSSLAFHFRFEREKKELFYSGDTPLEPLLFKQAEGKDYLIHDCSAPSRFFKMYPSLHEMHTHSLDLGSHSQSSSIKCLIPCHFFGELEFSLSEIENEIRENYKGKLIIPNDYEKIVL